ncbi:hypothetical protein HPCPY6311_0062 [Helicobacter pylori CPY6311]|nr:hypothetical protein HPCPY6311_0062 [Helicobacter pylori CPY6311]
MDILFYNCLLVRALDVWNFFTNKLIISQSIRKTRIINRHKLQKNIVKVLHLKMLRDIQKEYTVLVCELECSIF